jgi:hypothetical protein
VTVQPLPEALAAVEAGVVEHHHDELLTAYLEALDDASQKRGAYFARKLVESHVKRRLKTLADVYTQHAVVGRDRERYERMAADARTFAGTLPSLRLATVLALFPIAVVLFGPLWGALSGVSFDGWRIEGTGDIVMTALYGAFLVYYIAGLAPKAFRRKRGLLYPGAWHETADAEEGDGGRNAYRCEEAVFEALGRGRPTERSLDYILAAVVTGVLFVFGPILGLLAGVPIWGDAEDVPVPLVFLGYIPSIALAVWLRRNWRRRRWR